MYGQHVAINNSACSELSQLLGAWLAVMDCSEGIGNVQSSSVLYQLQGGITQL